MKQKFLATICVALLFMGTGQAWADAVVDGKLCGAFSVSATKVVYFSQGNLQAYYNGSSWTWKFATNQYDYIGEKAANVSITGNGTVSTNGTVDLFGWSTTNTYYGIHNSTDNNVYSGTFRDWGTNPIENGGNTANAWRTLTVDEWTYLLYTRTTASGIRYAKAIVNGKNGLILLPDNWNSGFYTLSNTNDSKADYTSNEITSYVWKTYLQELGAVFLPAAGERFTDYKTSTQTTIINVTSHGLYHTTTANGVYLFTCNCIKYDGDEDLRLGCSVRLVSETPPPFASVRTYPTAKSLTYNGKNQQLHTQGSATNGLTEFSFGNGQSWGHWFLLRTNAGTYTYYYYVKGNDGYANYIPSQNTFVTTIAKATPIVTDLTANIPTYNGAAQTLINAGSTTGGELQYKLNNGAYSTDLPQATAAGTYTVFYKVVGDSNYYDVAEQSISVTIAKADIVLTAPTAIEDLVYTGAAQTLINAGTAPGGELQYKLNDGEWSTELPSATDGGVYTIYYKVVGDANHNDVEAASLNVSIKNTITWKNEDGTMLKTDVLAYGETPAYTGDTPTKTATAEYTYTFNNSWNPTIVAVAADATYTAQFNATPNPYTLAWVLDGGTITTAGTAAGSVDYGTALTAPVVEKTGYTFKEWSPAVPATMPAADATYTATWTINQYTITFHSNGGSAVDPITQDYNTVITAPANPTRTGYTFAGWSQDVPATMPAKNLELTAQWTINKYTIVWKNEDGTMLKTDVLAYGETPAYTGATPTKEATAQYTYTFNDTWSPAIIAVTADATYTALFDAAIRSYVITFLDEDGATVLSDASWEYGAMPECPEPTKAEDENYTYAFKAWTPDIETVTGEATYTATYEATEKPQIPTGLDDTVSDSTAIKRIVNGQLLIEKNGRTFNALGVEVK